MGPLRGFREQGNIGNGDFDFWQQGNKAIQPEHDKTNKMTRAHGEDAEQPGHPPSLISVFAVRSMGSQVSKVS